jgi:hypothetical protein
VVFRPPHCWGLDMTIRHITIGKTSLDEWSAIRRYLNLTTHNTHKTQTSMLLAGFEPANPTTERVQTHVLDRAVTVLGSANFLHRLKFQNNFAVNTVSITANTIANLTSSNSRMPRYQDPSRSTPVTVAYPISFQHIAKQCRVPPNSRRMQTPYAIKSSVRGTVTKDTIKETTNILYVGHFRSSAHCMFSL